MSSVNQVIIVGRLGQEPDVKYLPNGDAICNLSVATSKRWKDKNSGEKREKTEWHRVVLYGKTAEFAGQWAKKGNQVYVRGELETREWEKDGIKRYTTEIKAQDFDPFIGGGSGEGRDSNNQAPRQQQQQRPQQQQQQRQQPAQQQNNFDDDMPF